MNQAYYEQVKLLLQVLPHVGAQEDFALKGGTAINLFYRDMPRLSVDIDLTYLPLIPREEALNAIQFSLKQIKQRIQRYDRMIEVTENLEKFKLLCDNKKARIKIEVNPVMRGHFLPVELKPLQPFAQDEFSQFVEISTLAQGELYGGKICAALDRQHPRDLFDLSPLLTEKFFPQDIKYGFIAALLSHDRPIHELLSPRFKLQEDIFNSQFEGMARTPYSYEQFLTDQTELPQTLLNTLSDDDKSFILAFKAGNPDWASFKYPEIQSLPAIQWKLLNIQKLANHNPSKDDKMISNLKSVLGNIN